MEVQYYDNYAAIDAFIPWVLGYIDGQPIYEGDSCPLPQLLTDVCPDWEDIPF